MSARFIASLNVAVVLYSSGLTTGCFSSYAGHWCACVKFCVSLDHYALAQQQIDQGTGLGMDSFEAGQPDGVETACFRSNCTNTTGGLNQS